MNYTHRIPSVLVVGGFMAAALAQTTNPPLKTKDAVAHRTAAVQHDPAERAFQMHCSRCHNPPETLYPSITGTVVRHMRVRANLSAADERLILHYFNP